MTEARNGNATLLRDLLSTREIQGNNLEIPHDFSARYAVHTNKKRSKINATVFRSYLRRFHPSDRNDAIPEGALIVRGFAS